MSSTEVENLLAQGYPVSVASLEAGPDDFLATGLVLGTTLGSRRVEGELWIARGGGGGDGKFLSLHLGQGLLQKRMIPNGRRQRLLQGQTFSRRRLYLEIHRKFLGLSEYRGKNHVQQSQQSGPSGEDSFIPCAIHKAWPWF
jgi:hypothetical protein